MKNKDGILTSHSLSRRFTGCHFSKLGLQS
jgi:hypothetical protein